MLMSANQISTHICSNWHLLREKILFLPCLSLPVHYSYKQLQLQVGHTFIFYSYSFSTRFSYSAYLALQAIAFQFITKWTKWIYNALARRGKYFSSWWEWTEISYIKYWQNDIFATLIPLANIDNCYYCWSLLGKVNKYLVAKFKQNKHILLWTRNKTNWFLSGCFYFVIYTSLSQLLLNTKTLLFSQSKS